MTDRTIYDHACLALSCAIVALAPYAGPIFWEILA